MSIIIHFKSVKCPIDTVTYLNRILSNGDSERGSYAMVVESKIYWVLNY